MGRLFSQQLFPPANNKPDGSKEAGPLFLSVCKKSRGKAGFTVLLKIAVAGEIIPSGYKFG